MKKDSIIINALILFSITLISGFLLGLTYNATQEARDYQTKLKTQVALNTVLENSKFIEESIEGEPKFITNVYQGNSAEDGSGDELGYAFQLETTEGYGDAIVLMVAFNKDGKINGIDIVSNSETPGLGAKSDEPAFKDQFKGKEISTLAITKGGTNPQDIDAIAGATITSRAVTNAVNEAIDYYNTVIKKEGK